MARQDFIIDEIDALQVILPQFILRQLPRVAVGDQIGLLCHGTGAHEQQSCQQGQQNLSHNHSPFCVLFQNESCFLQWITCRKMDVVSKKGYRRIFKSYYLV